MTTTKLAYTLAIIVPGGLALIAIAALLSFMWKRAATREGSARVPPLA